MPPPLPPPPTSPSLEPPSACGALVALVLSLAILLGPVHATDVDEGEVCGLIQLWLRCWMHSLKVLLSCCLPAAAILRKFRQAIYDTDPTWLAGLPGWLPNDTRSHCFWSHVVCQQEHVVSV